MKQRVLVTGISGYIGQHVGAELLKEGYEVVGTVRDQSKAESTKNALAGHYEEGQLSFVEADLLSDEGWAEAMKGCAYAIHVASPFVLAEPKDENDLIAPAVEGTRRVIKAAQEAGVKRLVLTSSIVAMVAGKNSGHYGPSSWSDTDANIGAYAKSKTLAEKAAWEASKNSEMEVVAINPGGVFGPTLGARAEGQSVEMITAMLNGKMPMIPDVALGMIDVRDVARLHVKALTAEGAQGKRFIAASSQPIELITVAEVLKNAGYAKVSTRKAPSIALRVMSLFDREARGVLPLLGKKITFDTTNTESILDWQPTPMETSFIDMAATLKN